MGLRSRLTKKVGKVFTKTTRRLESSVTVTLVKASATTDAFETVLAISSKWFFEYSNFRQKFLLQIGDDSGDLTNAMASATHVKIDNDYYVISEADTLPPKLADPTWKIFCDRFERRQRFEVL